MKLKHAIALAILATATAAAVAAPDVYRVSATESFSTANVYKIDTYQGGDVRFVRVQFLNGAESSYKDTNGLLQRILENQPEFTSVSGTNVYFNTLFAGRTKCESGTSTVYVQNSTLSVSANDRCAMVTAISAQAK